MGYRFDCRHFTGYKPCAWKRPCDGCPHYSPAAKRIAVLSLEALGAVLRSTCLLPAIRREWHDCHITWITYPNAKALLENNQLIDRLVTVDASTNAVLDHLKFDVLLAVDKSIEAGALAERIQAQEKRGFGLDSNGVIRPLNEEADYQYDVGLSDELKFFINQKPETQQITETMALKWSRDPYILNLREAEVAEVASRRATLLGRPDGTRWRAIRSCWMLPGTCAGNQRVCSLCAMVAALSDGAIRACQPSSRLIVVRGAAASGAAAPASSAARIARRSVLRITGARSVGPTPRHNKARRRAR